LFPGRPPSLPDEGTHGRRRGTFLLRTAWATTRTIDYHSLAV
jgi:hypothetical protein